MYRYDEIDQEMPLRLMNGLYLQLHAYMLRIAIPYGTLSSAQMRKLAHVARSYDRGYGHFTTRTNLQLHWIKLKDAPDILASLAEAELHATLTGVERSLVRVSADPLTYPLHIILRFELELALMVARQRAAEPVAEARRDC